MNYDRKLCYSEGDREEWGEIPAKHLLYQQGLMWTLAYHTRVSEGIRYRISKWGITKDEFTEGDPRKLVGTPAIDRLVREEIRFDRCLIPNPTESGPSRAAVMTGKYSQKNGFRNNRNSRFAGSQPTFPRNLRQAGYATAIIGKRLLVSNPIESGHAAEKTGSARSGFQGIFRRKVISAHPS